jgi:hypothetical protein
MSSWGNTDKLEDKPHWPFERTTRAGLDTANGTGTSLTYSANITTLAVTGAGAGVAANANTLYFQTTAGIKAGMAVTQVTVGGVQTSNLAYNSGEGGFFAGNVIVASVTNGTVTLTPAPGQGFALRGNVAVGDTFIFGNAISYPTGTYETTYWKDTILVTATREANNTVSVTHGNQGWVHIRKKINNDGTVRYLSETLVALGNPVASNTTSGQTSNTNVYTGV